jgi:hypothetical protein
VEDAEKSLRRAYETPIRSAAFGWQHASLPEFLLLRGRVGESLAASRRIEGSAGARAAGSAVEAEALLALGRTAEASRASLRASDALEEARKSLTGAERLYIERMAEPFVRLAKAEVDLAGGDPAGGEKAILEMADGIAADPRFDAWGEGLFKLERVAAAARRLGRPELAVEVEARMRRIDADYAPGSRSAPVEKVAGAGAAAIDARR